MLLRRRRPQRRSRKALLVSSSGGSADWVESGLGAHNWDDVAIASAGNFLVAIQYAADNFSDKGKLYTSANRGAVWTENVAAGERYYSSVAVSANGQIIFATSYNETGGYGGGSDGALIRSTNGGTSWSAITVDASPHRWETVSISTDGATVALCEYSKSDFSLSGSFWLSTTNGDSSSFTQKLGTHYWQKAAISADKQKIIVVSFTDIAAAPGVGGRIQLSTDGGANFAQASGDPQDRYQWCAISADGTQFAVAGYIEDDGTTNSHIFLSSDGNTWTAASSIGAQRWSSVAISDDGERLIASSFSVPPLNGNMYKSTNGGSTWARFTQFAPTYFLASAIAGAGSLAGATYYDFGSGVGSLILHELD